MAISTPPPAPSRNNPDTFSSRMDAFLAWLVSAVPEFNTLAILADGGTWQVTASNFDNIAGKLMKVGDFGIGVVAQAPGDDLSAIQVGGIYYADNSTANRPTGAGNWLVRHERRAINEYVQIAWSRSATVAGSYMRYCGGGSWSSWRRIYQQDNVIGPVTQTGGTPTGALIERGTNANGEYIRLADGTQICWVEGVISSNIAATTYSEANWTFPASFSLTPLVLPQTRSYNDAAGRQNAARYLRGVGGYASAATGTVGVFNSHTSAVYASIGGLAVGRWY